MIKIKTIHEGQNLYDVSTLIYGDVSKALLLALDNGQDLNYDLTGVKEISFSEFNYIIPTYKTATQFEAKKPTSYTVGSNQNIYDVALQLYSDPSNVFAVINYSLDDDVSFNQVVLIVEYESLNNASKIVIDLSGRIISTKKYEKVTYKYIGTETRIILTTESGFKLIIE